MFVSNDRLTGSDRRALLLWLVLAVCGTLFAWKNYFAAFPEAAVNFQVSREEALGRARSFVSGLGEDVSAYQSSIVFEVADGEEDGHAKTYLERELGLEQANRLMASEVSIWYWQVRFFRPQQKEEFEVRVSPAGKIVGYEHVIEEARAGAALERAAAEAVARQFLTARYGAVLSAWDFLPEEANSNQRPKRLDWSFTWEKHGFRAKDAPYRLRVTLQGDQVGGAEEYLQVPEAWRRSYKELRSSNEFYNVVAIVPYALLLGGALWLGVALTRRGQTSWGGAVKLGLVVAALLFLMQLNEWPLARAGYDTKESYASFVALKLAGAVLFALGSALTVALILPAAEPLYRVSQPGRLRLAETVTLRGLRSKEFFNAAFVGLCMAAAHIGFIVAFYMYGRRVGVWAPQELNYTDAVNTAFPWISGVAIGLLAATSEEFLFRLFAVPYLQKLTRSRWLAVVLPAFAWGFLHSAYPQEPGYIRGIEVGIVGVVAGVVMLRWGIMATLIWHYTVDALLVGMLLIRSDSLYFKVSGAIVGAAAVAPLVFAGVSYFLRGRFEDAEPLLNRATPLPDVRIASAAAPESAAAPVRRYAALTPGMIGFLAVCLVAGGAAAWKLKAETIGDYLRMSIHAREARNIADATLRARGLHPEGYRTATTFVSVSDPVTNEYLRRTVGIAEANRIYREETPGALWRVRYFREGQAEEYAVILRPDGAVHSLRHTLSEAAPGASLSKEEAVARAEKFLRETKKLDLSQWQLVEATSDKRPHRIDHTLTWERTAGFVRAGAPNGSAAEPPAHARLEVQVLGEEVANYRTFIKIPDEWRRAQEELTLPRTLYMIGRGVFFGGLVLTVLVFFLMRLRATATGVPWRTLKVWGFAGLGAFLLKFALGTSIPDLLANYRTEVPFPYAAGISAVVALFGGMVSLGTILLTFGLAWVYASRVFGTEQLPTLSGGGRALSRMPGAYYRDALWIGLGGTAALIGLHRFLAVAAGHWPTLHRSLDASVGQNFYAVLPVAAVLGGGILRGLLLTGLVALAAAFVAAEVRPLWLRAALFLLTALSLVGDWGSPGDFAGQFLAQGILLGVLIWGVCRVVRFNLLGYFLVAAGGMLFSGAAELLVQPNPFYRANGYAVLLVLAALFAWPCMNWQLRTDSKGT
jgi:membrane protease YdiL (CAAX protease family)